MPGRFGNQPAVCSNIVAMTVEVIVLAAGKGTRMWSQQPKVLLDLAGRPLLEHVITTLAGLETDRVHVVYGHGGDQVLTLSDHWPGLNWVCQDQQLGPVTLCYRRCRQSPTALRSWSYTGTCP